MKRILIDGRFIGVGESMTRYVLEFFSRLLKLDQESQYTLLIRPQGIKELPRYFNIDELEIEKLIRNSELEIRNLRVSVLDIPHYSSAEQTQFLSYLNHQKFDLVHFIQFNHPIFYRGKFVTTIHDLTLIGHLHYFNFAKKIAFNFVMRDAAKRSKKVIAISKTTMADVIDYYHVPKERFSVIYESVDHDRYNAKVKSETLPTGRQELKVKNFESKYNITGDYLLYTGMWKKHKNLIRLFQAYEKYQISNIKYQNKGRTIQLVLTGKIDTKESEVISEIKRVNEILNTKYNIPNPIITTGFIEEEELPIAYAGAMAYVIPSLSEGFGLPPLEAMACGTPVISSKESCMPEILGDAPLYFDPYDVSDIERAIKKITEDPTLRENLVKKGFEQVKKYDWQKTAEQTLNVYKEVLG